VIYTYGDSFTYGDCEEIERVEKPFSELLSLHYNVPAVNNGVSGASLLDIHLRLTADILDFKKGDLVIIGKTLPDRVQVPCHGGAELDIWKQAFFSEQAYSDTHPYFTSNKWVRGFPVSDPKYLSEVIEKYFNRLPWNILESIPNRQFLKEFIPLYTIYSDAVKMNFEHFYNKTFYNLGLKLASRGIDVVIWNWDMWKILGTDENICRCEHWNQKGHSLFKDIVTYFLETRSSKLEILLDSHKVVKDYYATIR